MADVLNIATQCNTSLQIIGLITISLLFVCCGIIIYKSIQFIGVIIIHFRKVDVTIDKDDFHNETHLYR